MQLLLYHQTNSVTISTILLGSRTCCMEQNLLYGTCGFLCVCCGCIFVFYVRKKKSKNVSLINHWTFLLLFQQLMTGNLYSESDTGLKFDSMSHSPWYCLDGRLHSECCSNKNQKTVSLFFISSTKLRWTAPLKNTPQNHKISPCEHLPLWFGTEEFQIFNQALA